MCMCTCVCVCLCVCVCVCIAPLHLLQQPGQHVHVYARRKYKISARMLFKDDKFTLSVVTK